MSLIHHGGALEGCKFPALHARKRRRDDDNDNYDDDDQRVGHTLTGNYKHAHALTQRHAHTSLQ